MKAEKFFTDAEKAEIAESIRQVEKNTAGEVAVLVVDASDTYPEAALVGGGLVGGLAALAAVDLLWQDSLWIFVPLALVLGGLSGWGLRLWPAARRFFVPAGRLESQVRERAVRAFYEKGLYQTREATGVLFFISLFEHRVWVLADKGINARLSSDQLQTYAGQVAVAVKGGKAAGVLCAEIGKIGEVLARHFPRRPDDINELTNRVMTN